MFWTYHQILWKFVDSKTLFMLIRSFTFPYIRYCSTTWSSASPHHIQKIQSVCDKTQLFSKDVPKIDVKGCINIDLSTLAFKSINNLLPLYISSKIKLSSNIHKYNTRHSTNLNIFCEPKFNKMSFQSINNSLAVVWNTTYRN